MTDSIEIVESTINAVTFNSPNLVGGRTYIEMEPGFWRPLYPSSGDLISTTLEIDATAADYFAERFAGEDLPENPGSGDGDGTGGGGEDGGVGNGGL